MVKKEDRIEWIDVSKGLAIVAIYIGHWLSPSNRTELFAYQFHLQLFFMISGFFAMNAQKKSPWLFLNNQIKRLIIPLILWSLINIIYFDISEHKSLTVMFREFTTVFTDFSASVSPELWFLPTLFVVTITFYFLYRFIKNKYIIFLLSYVLFIIQNCYSETLVGKIIMAPFIKLLCLSAIPTYLFWYTLGAILFPYINKIFTLHTDGDFIQKKAIRLSAGTGLLLSWAVFSFKADNIYNRLHDLLGGGGYRILNNDFIYRNYHIALSILICLSVMYLSYLFRKSLFWNNLGKNTLILMGLEFMTKNFLTFHLLRIFNIGLPNLDHEFQVITYAILTVLLASSFIKPINKHACYLNGK